MIRGYVFCKSVVLDSTAYAVMNTGVPLADVLNSSNTCMPLYALNASKVPREFINALYPLSEDCKNKFRYMAENYKFFNI